MDIDTILIDVLIDALVDDIDMKDWAYENYSKNFTIYKGIDLLKPPPEDDYPLLHIFPVRKNVGYDLVEKVHNIGVVAGIHNDVITPTTNANGIVIKKYQGIAHLEVWRALIEAVIVAYVPIDTWVDSIDISYEVIEAFPFFLCFSFFEISEKYCQGDNVFS